MIPGKRKFHIVILTVFVLTAVLSMRGYFVSTALKSAKNDFLQADYLLIEGNVGLSPREIVSVDQTLTNRADIARISDVVFQSVRPNVLIHSASTQDVYATELIVNLSSFAFGKRTATIRLIDASRIEINEIAWHVPDENGPCDKIHQILLDLRRANPPGGTVK